jgi:SARP family transcriptional regulator, regulator of embCAB operon
MSSPHSTIRVRVLGGLDVVRADATHVAVDEWGTGKTMDLMRLLALANGRPVRSASLIEKLWPDVTPERGRGSLRTASSRIRRAVGQNCIVRRPDGLVLTGAWVDAEEFVTQARLTHAAARELDHPRVLAMARATTILYRGGFQAHDDESSWARTERAHLSQHQHDMLRQAAESALALGLFREGLDFATEAVRIDRDSETAHRALMRAHAELGEIGTALRVFESYRAHLADELGADPSPQTRELHLRLLRGTA